MSAPSEDQDGGLAGIKKSSKTDYVFCGRCNKTRLWPDDPHPNCFKCRGISHPACEDCTKMGGPSSAKWAEYLRDHSSQNSDIVNTLAVQDQSQKYVSMDQFNSLLEAVHTLKESVDKLSTPSKREHVVGSPGDGTSHTARGKAYQTFGVGPVTQPHKSNVSLFGGAHEAALISKERGNLESNRGVKRSHDMEEGEVEDEELQLHPSRDEEFDDDSSAAGHSSWDHKRRSDRDDSLGPDDSVSQVGSESKKIEEKVDQTYLEVVTEMVQFLSIKGADTKQAEHADIMSSRVKDKAAKVALPMAQSHKNIVQDVWSQPSSKWSTYRKSLTGRYQIAEADSEDFLKVSGHDKLLVHALRREGVKFKPSKKKSEPVPQLPDKTQGQLESKAWRMEKQALLGLGCASSQSWLIEFIVKKFEQMDSFLQDKLGPDNYSELIKESGCQSIGKAVLLAQDAALDQLDLYARIAANAKSQRRTWWLEQTKWDKDLRERVVKFPIVSGQLFGEKLFDTVSEFKDFDEALEHTETSIKGSQKGKDVKYVKNTVASLGNKNKKQKTSHDTSWKSGNQAGTSQGGRVNQSTSYQHKQSDRSGQKGHFGKSKNWSASWSQGRSNYKGPAGQKSQPKWRDQSGSR